MGGVKKGQNLDYVIFEWSLIVRFDYRVVGLVQKGRNLDYVIFEGSLTFNGLLVGTTLAPSCS